MQAVDRHRKMVGKDDAQDKLIKYMLSLIHISEPTRH